MPNDDKQVQDSYFPLQKDSARHLEWLRTVKDSHGSVELSSLSLATAINNKGIYVISAHDVKMVNDTNKVKSTSFVQ